MKTQMMKMILISMPFKQKKMKRCSVVGHKNRRKMIEKKEDMSDKR